MFVSPWAISPSTLAGVGAATDADAWGTAGFAAFAVWLAWTATASVLVARRAGIPTEPLAVDPDLVPAGVSA
jgi:hypothetical protein